MTKLMNLTNQRYGRLLIVSRADNNIRNRVQWLCRCECGNETIVQSDRLRSGQTKSCGCLALELIRNNCYMLKHGHWANGRASTTYASWQSMKQRCKNPNSPAYKYYGERGIKVCQRWRASFTDFLVDMGERPDGTSIDRIDNDGNYEPENCRWATVKQQHANYIHRNQYMRPLT